MENTVDSMNQNDAAVADNGEKYENAVISEETNPTEGEKTVVEEETEASEEKKKRKKTGKKVKIIVLVAILIIVAVAATLLWYNSPSNMLNRSLDSRNYEAISEIMEKNKNNTKFKSKADRSFTEYAEELLDKYVDGSIEDSVVTEYFKNIKQYKTFEELEGNFNSVKASKKHYIQAKNLEEKEKYKSAIDEYRGVIKEDKKNYPVAQEKLKELSGVYSTELLVKANKLYADSDYNKMYFVLNVSSIYTTEEYENEKAVLIDNANKAIIGETNRLLGEESTEKAYTYIRHFSSNLCNHEADTLKSDVEKQFLDELKSLIDELINAGKPEEAKTAIESARTNTGNSQLFTAEYEDCDKTISINYLKSCKGKVTVYNDSFNDNITIGPAGVSPKYVWPNRIFYPRVHLNSYGNYGYGHVFSLMLGFERSDWLFMDSVYVKVDGKTHTFSVSWSDRNSDASGWGIKEWYVANNLLSKSKVNDLMNDIKLDSSVTIRFSGDDGTYDYTLPKSKVDEAVMMWKIWGILSEYDSKEDSMYQYLS